MRSPSCALLRSLPLLLVTVTAALAGACAQVARADEVASSASVTLVPSGGGESRSLASADLAAQEDVRDARYTLRAADGSTSTKPVMAGTSITALLRAARLDDDPYTFIAVAAPDGSTALLQRDDLGGTDEGPPVVWSDEQGVHFLRPSEDAEDANAEELVSASDGALIFTLQTGTPVKPQIAVSTLRGRPRQRIEFSASLADGTLPPGTRYQWYFDGSGTVDGANVTHRFPHAGSWLVLLNVVRGQGATIGLPARVDVRIVAPRRAADRGGARRSEEGSGGAGSDGAGGSGTGTGGGSGGGAGAGSGTGTGSDTGALPGAVPSSLPPAAPVVPSASPPRHAPDPSSPAAPREPQGEIVTGTLIASTGALPASAGDTRGTSAAAGAGTHGPLDIPVGVWIAIGLVALVALGWTLESRHTLPFWQP